MPRTNRGVGRCSVLLTVRRIKRPCWRSSVVKRCTTHQCLRHSLFSLDYRALFVQQLDAHVDSDLMARVKLIF